MPTSVPYCVPVIASIARQLRPKSVLDVGVGFGKYGFLFREYLDIWDMESVADYHRSAWKTRIEGIEATRDYLTPLHEYIYDRIHTGDARDVVEKLGSFDVIVMGDVLEHFEKADGAALVRKLFDRANLCVILTFPPDAEPNHDVLGNPYEAHRSGWNHGDFETYPEVGYKVFEGKSALTVLTKPPQRPPLLTPCLAARRRGGWKQAVATVMVRALGPIAASRIASQVGRRPIHLR